MAALALAAVGLAASAAATWAEFRPGLGSGGLGSGLGWVPAGLGPAWAAVPAWAGFRPPGLVRAGLGSGGGVKSHPPRLSLE